jgi:hypothetical protein
MSKVLGDKKSTVIVKFAFCDARVHSARLLQGREWLAPGSALVFGFQPINRAKKSCQVPARSFLVDSSSVFLTTSHSLYMAK